MALEADKPGMTIARAGEIFRMGGGGSIEHASIVQMLEDHRMGTSAGFLGEQYSTPLREPLHIKGQVATLGYTKAILDRTRESFFMVTGSDLLARELEQEFRDMIERLLKTGGKARVVVLDGDSTKFEEIRNEYPMGIYDIETGTLKPGAKSGRHYYVSDAKRSRCEELHSPITSASSAQVVEADLYFNNEPIANTLLQKFYRTWETVTGEDISPKPKQKRSWWKPF